MELQSLILSIATVLLIFIFPIVVIPILAIFACYRQIIIYILKMKHGEEFYGLIGGGDVIWAFDDVSKSIVHTILVVNSDMTVEDFITTVKNVVWHGCLKREPKLSYVRKKFSGYNYFLGHHYPRENCVKTIYVNGVFDEAYIRTFVSNYSKRNMPVNDTGLWEILIFDKPINWVKASANNLTQYIVLFRIHHCLADGLSLFHFFVEYFTDSLEHKIYFENQIRNCRKNVQTKHWLSHLGSILWGPAVVIVKTLFKPADRSTLDSYKLSGENIMAFAVEEEERLVPMIKTIKNSKETRFSDVVLAAISASFKEFFSMKNQKVPKLIPCLFPMPIKCFEKPNFYELSNNFSVALLQLPIRLDGDIVATLDEVKAQTQALRNSPDDMVNYFLLMVIAAIIPEPLVRLLVWNVHSTVAISILPGTHKLSIFEQQTLHDWVFWIAHRGTTGLGLSVLTYDNRLQVGLAADKVVLSNQKDLQIIVDGVPKNILELYHKLFGNVSRV